MGFTLAAAGAAGWSTMASTNRGINSLVIKHDPIVVSSVDQQCWLDIKEKAYYGMICWSLDSANTSKYSSVNDWRQGKPTLSHHWSRLVVTNWKHVPLSLAMRKFKAGDVTKSGLFLPSMKFFFPIYFSQVSECCSNNTTGLPIPPIAGPQCWILVSFLLQQLFHHPRVFSFDSPNLLHIHGFHCLESLISLVFAHFPEPICFIFLGVAHYAYFPQPICFISLVFAYFFWHNLWDKSTVTPSAGFFNHS